MKRSILALASGAFILGAAEFVMMGILPQTATAMHVTAFPRPAITSPHTPSACVSAH